MASNKVGGFQNSRRITRRIVQVCGILGCETVDALYLRAGRARNVRPADTINHIGEFYLAEQGDGNVSPPDYVRQLINSTLREERERQKTTRAKRRVFNTPEGQYAPL